MKLEAAYKIFGECWNGDDVAFQRYALKTNAIEKNNVGNDLSIVVNGINQSSRNLYIDAYKFE